MKLKKLAFTLIAIPITVLIVIAIGSIITLIIENYKLHGFKHIIPWTLIAMFISGIILLAMINKDDDSYDY